MRPARPELDRVDRDLLALLQANARESTANLARRLGLARTTVLARIARLERSGVVAGYGVRLGSALSTGLAAYVGISVLPKAGPQVLRALDKLLEIEQLSAVSGELDYMALLRCSSSEHLDQVLDTIGQLEGVRQTRSFVLLATKIDRRGV